MDHMLWPVVLALFLHGGVPTGSGVAPAPAPAVHYPSIADFDSIRTDLSDYEWPTDASNVITSTFGEFRRTHFHGGIDISTHDRTGYRVFASRAGYIIRVRVSPTGYGKMLYVRHPDGYTTTYAHLSRFNTAIEAWVRKEQQRLDRYPVDIDCPPGQFPVKKGDLIAYTGDTGIGSPHLHFEIRDEHMNPLNPFLCENFSTPDDIAPVIRKLSVTPLGRESSVNGSSEPQIFRARQAAPHDYRIRELIHITGRAGFALDSRDLSNGTWFKHGVHRQVLFVDGQQVFAMSMDRAPFEESEQIRLDYEWQLFRAGRGRFQKLYMDTPNDLPFYEPRTDHAGMISPSDFPEGQHAFRIVCQDVNGNRSTVTGDFILNHAPIVEVSLRGSDLLVHVPEADKIRRVLIGTGRAWEDVWNVRIETTSGTSPFQYALPRGEYDVIRVVAENIWGSRSAPEFTFLRKPSGPAKPVLLEHELRRDYVRVLLRSDGAFTAAPSVYVYEGESRRPVMMTPSDLHHYTGTFIPLDSFNGLRRVAAEAEINGRQTITDDEFNLYPIRRNASGMLSLDNGNLLIGYDSLSVLKTVWLSVEKETTSDGPLYAFEPDWTVLDRGLTVAVRVNPAIEKQALFLRVDGRRSFLAGAKPGSSTISAKLTEILGDLMIAQDPNPPSIAAVSVRDARSRKPAISFRFGDDLSGVEYNELKMYIDGISAIPEIDGEHHRATYRVSDPLARGSHQLVIRLMDRMGNRRELKKTFTVR